MKNPQEGIERINNWLESGQDYEEGVALFASLSKNPTLKKLFPGREAKFRSKLTYELTKLAGRPFEPIPVRMEKELKPSSLPPVVLPEAIAGSAGNLPKIVGRVIREYSKLYNQRSMDHKAIKAIPQDNRPENVFARQKLLDRIAASSARMDELYLAKSSYEKDGTLPDERALFPKKVREAAPAFSPEEIQRKMDNTQKSLNKDLSLLTYQSLKKLPKPNPMPAGPKRSEIEKRVKEKKALISNLQKQLNGPDQNL